MATTITDRLNGLESGIAVKVPCRVATTTNITLSGIQTIDGISVASGDRVLVKDQTSSIDNGIWIAANGAWSRATDFDGSLDVVGGTQIAVISGTINGRSWWMVDGGGSLQPGTDAISIIVGLTSADASFSHGISYSPGTVGKRLQNEVWIEDAPYSADNTGAVSAVAALNAAFTHAALTGKIVRAGPGTFLIDGLVTNPGVPFIGSGHATLLQRSGVGNIFTNAYTLPSTTGYALNSAALHATAITLTTAGDAANFAADSYAIVFSADAYDSPALDTQRKGEFVRIKSISSGTLTLYGPLSDTYATTPKITPVALTEGLEYRDFACRMDKTAGTVGGANSGTEDRQVITTRFALRPKFSNLLMYDSLGPGIALEGCIDAYVDGHFAHDFGSATNETDGSATDGFGGYGYGISERGINSGLVATNLHYQRIRHGYTNGASYIFAYGRPVGAALSDGVHLNAKLSGWDTHQCGFGQRFTNLWAFGSMGVGLSTRCKNVVMRGCGAVDCLGAAVALYNDGATADAQECLIDGFYAKDCNWGNDGTTDWTAQPCFLDQGGSNTFQNLRVDSCYGHLYAPGPSSTRPTLRGVRAKNINANGTASFAIRLRQTGADVVSLSDIEIDVSNGKITDLIFSDANSSANVPDIDDVRWVNGSISGVPFNGNGAGTNHYVNWTGAGYRGYRKAITLNGSNTFSLAAERGTVFTVAKTASETLDTATGRSLEGARLTIIAGTGGITVTHSASGADTFFLKGAVNAVLTANQSIEVESRSGVWVEVGRSF